MLPQRQQRTFIIRLPGTSASLNTWGNSIIAGIHEGKVKLEEKDWCTETEAASHQR